MPLKVLQKEYHELTQEPLFKKMSEVQGQETLTVDLNKDLARTNFIMSNTTVEQAKSKIQKNWKDGFCQGDLTGNNFAGTLQSILVVSKINQDQDQDQDPGNEYMATSDKSISFCYDTSEGFNGFSISLAYNPEQPNQPYFIIQHTKNINGKFEDREVTLIGQGVLFDNEILKSTNDGAAIATDDLSENLQNKLAQIIENDAVKKLVRPLFNKNELGLDKLAELSKRLCNFNLDHQEQKKALLQKIKNVKSDLKDIKELINKPVGDDSWIDTNFQKRLDTYTSELTGDQIKEVLTAIDYIEDHDEEHRAQNHIKSQWKARLNSGSLKHDNSTLIMKNSQSSYHSFDPNQNSSTKTLNTGWLVQRYVPIFHPIETYLFSLNNWTNLKKTFFHLQKKGTTNQLHKTLRRSIHRLNNLSRYLVINYITQVFYDAHSTLKCDTQST
jgi:hypothetical protein